MIVKVRGRRDHTHWPSSPPYANTRGVVVHFTHILLFLSVCTLLLSHNMALISYKHRTTIIMKPHSSVY